MTAVDVNTATVFLAAVALGVVGLVALAFGFVLRAWWEPPLGLGLPESDGAEEFKCYEFGHDWREGRTEWRATGFDIDEDRTNDWSDTPPEMSGVPVYTQRVRFVRRKQCHTCGETSEDFLRTYVLPSEADPEDAPTLREEYREARQGRVRGQPQDYS